MSVFLQNTTSLFLTFLADAIIFGVVFFLLIYQFAVIMVGADAVSITNRPIINATIVGAAHGLVSCLLILYFNPKSALPNALLTALATVIVTIPATFFIMLQDNRVELSTVSAQFIINSVKDIGVFGLFISVILFIPSFLTGLLIGKLRSLFFSTTLN